MQQKSRMIFSIFGENVEYRRYAKQPDKILNLNKKKQIILGQNKALCCATYKLLEIERYPHKYTIKLWKRY